MSISLHFTPTRPPRAHQLRAIAKARGRPAFFVRMETGTGKSKVAIDEMIELHLTEGVDHALVTAGKGSYADWVEKHLPENVPESVPVVWHLWRGGKTQRERAALDDLLATPPGILKVLVMNIEALGMSDAAVKIARHFVEVRAGGKALIVCDESTKIKNESARRSRVMIGLGSTARWRRAMTGTAATKSPLDLWGQLKFLRLDDVVGRSYYAFRARFCVMKKMKVTRDTLNGAGQIIRPGRFVDKVVGYRNLDDLNRLLEPHGIRVLKEECLDLPPKDYQRVVVELSDEQKRVYDDMRKLAMAELQEGVFASARTAVTAMLKLHHVACGWIRDETGVTHKLENSRLTVLEDILDENPQPLVVWCAYQEDVRQILEMISKKFTERRAVDYYGLTTERDRAENLRSFCAGEADVFVGTQATGGFGLDGMQRVCHTAVYYSNSFDLEHRLQSEGRLDRDGQRAPVTYIDLVARGTVDERVVTNLREKKTMVDAIEGDGVRKWLEWGD